MTKTHITDLDISTERVSLRVNGEALAIVKVKEGRNVVWRVEFRDSSLSSGVFADPERALRWIAAGRPPPCADAAPDRKIVAAPDPRQEKHAPDEAKEAEPEWEIIKREPRREPIWNGRMSAFQGGITLLDPALLVRGSRPVQAAAAVPDTTATPAGPPETSKPR